MTSKLRYNFLTIMLLIGCISYAQQNYWNKSSKTAQENLSKYHFQNDKVHLFELDKDKLINITSKAPSRKQSKKSSASIINIPGFDGKIESFHIYESSVFSPSLAKKYPNIKSYIGYDTANSATILRMSVSPKGVQTMITYIGKPTVFMQPTKHGASSYVVYDKSSKAALEDPFECQTIDQINKAYHSPSTNRDANDQILRSFRLAVSVNGEYTTYHGGTVEGALAAINATLTRVNAVFETDMAVTFELVDATELIYLDATTDPYSASLDNWNVELQNTLTNTIGNAAYDIGHMFGASGGGGNAGCIGCVCVDDTASTDDQNKGSGITSPADGIPEGDNFDIDYVAHEIGHQMGANHTFSHTTEGTGVNAEPGSGSTIMGYAGIVAGSNVQQHSDAYFHYHSINQILNNLDSKTCWVGTAITNNPPVANAGNDYTIPQGTAYVLKGAATDADGGDTLSYCWEQTDSGTVTSASFGPTLTSGSTNRSLPPSSSPDRHIPKLSRVIAGQLTQTNPIINSDWETIVTVGRTQNWALTVRDRDASATGLNGQSSFDLMQIVVDADAGPFVVTSQSSNETWDVGSTQTITWDVAGTDSGNINAATINIKLSTDGGLTFPFTLASNVSNDGSQSITVPVTGGDSTTARVLVEANSNIFYAINSTNFSIQESEFALTLTDTSVDVCEPADAVYNFTYNTYLGFTDTTIFSTSGLPAGATAVFSPATATADDTPVTVTISGTAAVGVGNYTFNLIGTSGSIVKDTEVVLNIYNNSFNALNLTSPANGATNIPANVNLTWDVDPNAQNYDIEIATDLGFSNIIESTTISNNNYSPTGLGSNTEYFWRVKAVNLCGDGAFSTTYSFTTLDINCQSFSATDTPISIPDNDATGITSILNITNNDGVQITDLNITLNVTHPWIGDLIITLISPDGTEVNLVDSRNDPGQNYTNTSFDDSASGDLSSGSAPYAGTFKPLGTLSSFNGEYSNGNWSLKVSDDGPADIGSLIDWTLDICGSPIPDTDGDGITDNNDNCIATANADQADFDNDGLGDTCDDDIDNDGITNAQDLCDDTPLGDTVDVNGCSIFSLPVDNFSISINSETCRNSNNGSISISATAIYDYTAQLTGNGLDVSNDFTTSTDFTNLQAGNYTVCITVGGQPDYEQCYDITITEPEDLSVLSRVNSTTGKVSLELSGGTSYTIELNNTVIQTQESTIELDLKPGINTLKITTDADCQGTYRETINYNSKTIVSPNPLGSEDLNIHLFDSSIKTAQIAVYTTVGKLLISKKVDLANGKATINLSNLSSGVYIVNVNTGATQTNHKIIKK